MRIDVEVLLIDNRDKIIGKQIDLVTNRTGVDSYIKSTRVLFYEDPDIDLQALIAPEHGIHGDAAEGEHIENFTDLRTELPIYSLYGKIRSPSAKMLEAIDLMVLDLQDIGARYYTYIYTMAEVMVACGENGVPMLILDRPNPINGIHAEG